MFKKNILIFSIVLLSASHSSIHAVKKIIASAPVLRSPVVKLIDGMPGGLSGENIGLMVHVRTEIRNKQYGTPNKETKKRVGHYIIEDIAHSIHQLANMELRYQHILDEEREALEQKYLNHAAFKEEWHTIKAELKETFDKHLAKQEAIVTKKFKKSAQDKRELEIKKMIRVETRKFKKEVHEKKEECKSKHLVHKDHFEKELTQSIEEYKNRLVPLQNIIQEAKEDIITLAEPFMNSLRATKKFMVHIIEEWAEATGRKDSPLLKWHEQESGTEMDIFRENVRSFKHLDTLCSDLNSLFDTMINTCQKGFQQYVNLVKKK